MDETATGVVRPILEKVASGAPMWTVKATLEAEVPRHLPGEAVESDDSAQDDPERLPQTSHRRGAHGTGAVTIVASLDPNKRYGVSRCPPQKSLWSFGLFRGRLAASLDCPSAGSRIDP